MLLARDRKSFACSPSQFGEVRDILRSCGPRTRLALARIYRPRAAGGLLEGLPFVGLSACHKAVRCIVGSG